MSSRHFRLWSLGHTAELQGNKASRKTCRSSNKPKTNKHLPPIPTPRKERKGINYHFHGQSLSTVTSAKQIGATRQQSLRWVVAAMSFYIIRFMTDHVIDPFRLNLRACAMDWRKRFAGSSGERVCWVAGREHSCISLVLVVVKANYQQA